VQIEWTQVIIAYLIGVFTAAMAKNLLSSAKSKVTGG
jgi:hypothetical protein